MSQTVQETITTRDRPVTPVIVRTVQSAEATSYQTAEYIIYFIFGAIEILLAFRLILMLSGASLSSGFVKFIYDFSQIFVGPFDNIFRTGVAQVTGSTNLVFEPSILVAIAVYTVVAFGIVQLIRVLSGKKQEVE
jgi:hypothetical protein